MTRTPMMVATAVVLAMAATRVTAQDVNRVRSGFSLSLGLGQGSAGVTCEDCGVDVSDRMSGLSGYLRLGGFVSPRFLVGVEGTGWLHNSDGLERRIAAISLVLVGYPSANAGFHVRSGFGGIRAVIENSAVSVVGTGLTWNAGLGYDIGSGPVAITPYVTYLGSLQVSVDVNEVSTGINLDPNILQFGLALTVR